jgi:hypothetical protein
MPLPEPSNPPATIPARETQLTKPAMPVDPAAPVVVEVRRQGESVRLTFPFVVATPAAVFRRADTITLVFDSQAPIDINKIATQSGQTIRNAAVTRSRQGQVIQLKLDRPKLASIGAEGLAVEFVPFRGGPDLLKAVMVGECLVGISGSTGLRAVPI